MAYEAHGELLADLGTQQVSEKFRKREFVLAIQEGQYPQQVKFQLTQDKCDLLDGFQSGAQLTVTFDLRGRGYDKNGQTLYFTNLEAWKVQAAGSAPQSGNMGTQAQNAPRPPMANNNSNLQKPAAPVPNAASFTSTEADNDLPF